MAVGIVDNEEAALVATDWGRKPPRYMGTAFSSRRTAHAPCRALSSVEHLAGRRRATAGSVNLCHPAVLRAAAARSCCESRGHQSGYAVLSHQLMNHGAASCAILTIVHVFNAATSRATAATPMRDGGRLAASARRHAHSGRARYATRGATDWYAR